MISRLYRSPRPAYWQDWWPAIVINRYGPRPDLVGDKQHRETVMMRWKPIFSTAACVFAALPKIDVLSVMVFLKDEWHQHIEKAKIKTCIQYRLISTIYGEYEKVHLKDEKQFIFLEKAHLKHGINAGHPPCMRPLTQEPSFLNA